MTKNFNIRTYACVIKEKAVLGLFERYRGKNLLKFPGGGLEYGEGLIDCLHQELEEELSAKIKILEHLYTQDSLIESHFEDGNQLLSIYYIAQFTHEDNFIIKEQCIEKAEWISIEKHENPFSLPSDRIAFNKLKEKFL
ncbi:NUDIX domain-containing protein [Chryseobacterium indologenes]|uniref:NUDIX domain-containing protein n=1 Tax=Chryseobacterium indologenes TaxID=253 RepID=UPI0023E75800|nr:NUDIX domain-containing protein [Chryseobacterium indologenes]WET49812.1 NUDIX domain-containing protein [Chryseobacterium indologenes]